MGLGSHTTIERDAEGCGLVGTLQSRRENLPNLRVIGSPIQALFWLEWAAH
jgi:hypothetical protein